jgi:hypothetical protein
LAADWERWRVSEERSWTDEVSRRRFLHDAGVATLAVAAAADPALAARRRHVRRHARCPTVAVFGGGIAGLTAAHELAERGFDVTVYERRAWGGKMRSFGVPGSAAARRRDLPAEHALHAEGGCYENLIDTMRRIPFGSNARGVFDNMVVVPQGGFLRAAKRDLWLPLLSLDPRPYTPNEGIDTLIGLLIQQEFPPAAVAYFAQRMAVFFSSCDARRLGQWEPMPWTEFIATDRFGQDYRRTLGAFPEITQASKAELTSAKYVGWLLEDWFLYPLLGRGTNGGVLRVLDAPTDEAFIGPWIAHLQALGARLRLHRELTRWYVHNGRIVGAQIRTPQGKHEHVNANYFVCALPVERARRLWNREVLAADPSLARMNNLQTAWMNGIMFYLRERSQIVDGFAACCDAPWIVSFIPEPQFWRGDFASRYGDGTVRDLISAQIVDIGEPGTTTGKPVPDCTPEEIAHEVWYQL